MCRISFFNTRGGKYSHSSGTVGGRVDAGVEREGVTESVEDESSAGGQKGVLTPLMLLPPLPPFAWLFSELDRRRDGSWKPGENSRDEAMSVFVARYMASESGERQFAASSSEADRDGSTI